MAGHHPLTSCSGVATEFNAQTAAAISARQDGSSRISRVHVRSRPSLARAGAKQIFVQPEVLPGSRPQQPLLTSRAPITIGQPTAAYRQKSSDPCLQCPDEPISATDPTAPRAVTRYRLLCRATIRIRVAATALTRPRSWSLPKQAVVVKRIVVRSTIWKPAIGTVLIFPSGLALTLHRAIANL